MATSVNYSSLFHHWQRKAIAIVAAVVIWLLVNNAITVTRTFPNVPVRIAQLPTDKTIEGLSPDSYLKKTMSLTVTGKRSVLASLDPSDIEVLLSAAHQNDDWIISLSKKNIVSTNPEVNLRNALSKVTHSDYIIRLSKLITDTITVKIKKQRGEPPAGYQFIDIWPQRVTYTVSGPEENVMELKNKGLSLIFDLGDISQADLDNLERSSHPMQEDEVVYFIPNSWKHIPQELEKYSLQLLTDPAGRKVHITFLKTSVLPLEQQLPIRIFYSPDDRDRVNPQTYSLLENDLISMMHGMPVLGTSLYVKNVSQQFLDVIQHHLELVVIADPFSENDSSHWCVQFINPKVLEEHYVASMLAGQHVQENDALPARWHDEQLRFRFRHYMREFTLLKEREKPFDLTVEYTGRSIILNDRSR